MMSAKEKALLKDIAAQLVLTFKSKGITKPSPEQISEAFVAQCKRNIELSEIVVYGYNSESGRCYQAEQRALVSGLSKAVYDSIRSAA
jgi:hypothetical protein